MQTLETTWTDATGTSHTVTTTWDGTETPEQFVARHAAAVASMQKQYPPAG